MTQRPCQIELLLPGGERRSIRVEQEEMILPAAWRQGVELPSMCLQGWCLTCAGKVESEGDWDQSYSTRYYDVDREAGYILLCTARPRSDLTIRTHQRDPMRAFRRRRRLPTPRG